MWGRIRCIQDNSIVIWVNSKRTFSMLMISEWCDILTKLIFGGFKLELPETKYKSELAKITSNWFFMTFQTLGNHHRYLLFTHLVCPLNINSRAGFELCQSPVHHTHPIYWLLRICICCFHFFCVFDPHINLTQL